MDPTTINKLEQLARLKESGALSETEFATAKAKLFEADPTHIDHVLAAKDRDTLTANVDLLSAIWRRRFRFIVAHGLPGSSSHSAALRSLPLLERIRMSQSLRAFLLGPFYFLFLGLWRPMLTLLAATLMYAVILDLLELPAAIDRVSWVVPAVIYAQTCIPLYYLRFVKDINSWNPFAWRSARHQLERS